ncbi:hypothetical protein SUDANB106_01688 [Streptomyces sp. enrichment culture]|uniref:hypothetical protein n=1 Tax=Streptomyces sp. enrichment culture TaxID=1795815 RepID=UPI003F558D16
MKAWQVEAARHDWSALRCGCGETGAHLPRTFDWLMSARAPGEVTECLLSGHLEEQSMLFRVAPSAVPVILAALAEEPPRFVRGRLLSVLGYLVAGESHRSEAEAGFPDLAEECRRAAGEGLWVLYREAASGDAEAVPDVLEFADPDQRRFHHFRSAPERRAGERRS